MPRWDQVTAIFGGTFDPPHLGHRQAVQGLFENPRISKVLVIPAASPPHKPCLAPAQDRLSMARLNFALPDVEVDDRELRRSGPSYTFFTLQELKRDYPGREMAFVIGVDQLEKISTWHRFPEVLDFCHWIVLERKPHGHLKAAVAIRELQSSHVLRRPSGSSSWELRSGKTLLLVPTEARELSSTRIRETIARSGTPGEGTLLPAVEAHLKTHRVYGMTTSK